MRALSQIMTGAGISLLTTTLDVSAFRVDHVHDVDVICLSVTGDGSGAQVYPLAVVVDDLLLDLLDAPEDWEVQDGRG
jgi:hypothetical protein